MKYSDEKPAREPDSMVILNAHIERIRPTYVDGIADIVIEVLSPESDARDRGDKFVEYEAAGVPEYWLFDPMRQDALIYGRGEDGYYHRLPRDEQGRLISQVLPGFVLSPDVLWQETLPSGPDMVRLVEGMGTAES
jgi:Uma2 family endonuclease